MMIGEIGHILPDGTAEDMDEVYVLVAKAIVHAVLQKCHGLLGFSPVVTQCLLLPSTSSIRKWRSLPYSEKDVADLQLRHVLQTVSNRREITVTGIR